MALHNPNNWHWVNKDAREWTKDYLNEKLSHLDAQQDDVKAKIGKVSNMDGDVDVSQRKGKVITLFDVKLELDFEGSTKEEEKVTGTIKIPEVAHDTEEDEYVFDIDIFSPSASKEPVKDLIRSSIVPELRKVLQKLAPDLIKAHGKDIQHAPGSGPSAYSSGYSTPTNKTTSQPSKSSTTTGPAKSVNTVSVDSTTEFRTTAAELFVTFTDPGRITAFTRSPPVKFDGAKPGGKYAIFGGGVTGEYVDLKEPTRIVQKWRLLHWPEGHFSTLTLEFDQDDTNAVTNMRTHWDKVPVGEEDSTKEKWGEYYVRSLKTTFGFGTIL